MLPPDGRASVAVFGLGYVGSVTAACLAQLGHRVFGVDKDEIKVDSIQSGNAPFYEPGLEEIIRANVAAGRLSASVEAEASLAQSDIVLICVGTPSDRNGNLGLDQLRRVFQDLAEHLRTRTRPLIVTVRSTVFPGTAEELAAATLGGCFCFSIVSNPEFLREGTAVHDFMEPSLLVVGGADAASVRRVAGLYASLPVEPCLVSLRTAEMIKYCCNAFHALKIAFANEVGTLGAGLRVAPNEVMDDALPRHPSQHLPGLPEARLRLRRLLSAEGPPRALTYRAVRMDLDLPLLESVLPSNQSHTARAVARVLDSAGSRVGIFGLAFKEETDDLRESPIPLQPSNSG